MIKRFFIAAPLVALASLSACDKQATPLYVDGGYVRLNANPDNPAAGYFTIHGGPQAVVLRTVQTDAAVRLEVHESVQEDGMVTMKPVEEIDVPAETDVKLEPGGKHIMLWKVNAQAIAAGKMTFKFIFSNGDAILADAIIQGPDGQVTGHGTAPTAGADTVETTQIK